MYCYSHLTSILTHHLCLKVNLPYFCIASATSIHKSFLESTWNVKTRTTPHCPCVVLKVVKTSWENCGYTKSYWVTLGESSMFCNDLTVWKVKAHSQRTPWGHHPRTSRILSRSWSLAAMHHSYINSLTFNLSLNWWFRAGGNLMFLLGFCWNKILKKYVWPCFDYIGRYNGGNVEGLVIMYSSQKYNHIWYITLYCKSICYTIISLPTLQSIWLTKNPKVVPSQMSVKFRFSLGGSVFAWASLLSEARFQFSSAHADNIQRHPSKEASSLYHCLWFLKYCAFRLKTYPAPTGQSYADIPWVLPKHNRGFTWLFIGIPS